MEPDLYDDAFQGGVLGREIDGRRMPAKLVCTATSLRAIGKGGRTVEIPYHGMRLEMGGATGRMIFCRNADRSLTIFCEEKGFLDALRENSRDLLADELDRLTSQRRHGCRRVLVWSSVVILLIMGAIYAARPLIRGAVTMILPYSVDEAIGKAAFSSMEKGGPVVENQVLDSALRKIIDRLQPHAAIPQADFRVEVVKSEMVNAYALPGGYLVVFTGLIDEAQRAEEVAGVLAHEMAHVTLRHGMQRMVQGAAVVILVSAIFGDASGLMAMAVEFFTWQTINSYSRGSEEEADAEGVRMLHAARIDPSGLTDFFTRLSEEGGDAPEVLSWLGTHPAHEERVDAIQTRISSLEKVAYEPLDIDWEAVRASLK